jgi:PAS domain S-box-containing protein
VENSPSEEMDALLRDNAALREQNDELRRALARDERPSAGPANERVARARMYEHFALAPFLVAAFVGPEHVIEFANPMALAAWGKTRSVIGKPLVEVMPEMLGQPFVGYLDGVRASGVAYRGFSELARLARAPGGAIEEAYYDFVYSPMGLPDGTVDGVLMFSFEVTVQVLAQNERLRMIEEIRAAERDVREVVDNLPDLAWTTLADGRADFYNRRWYEFTGTRPEDIRTMGVRTVDDPAALEVIRVRWRECLATGQPFEMEHTLRGADGTSRWFLTRVMPLHDAAGKLRRWIGSSVDIDDRRREQAFRETFLGVLGHDLRNPLSAVLTTARILIKRDSVAAQIRPQLERIVRSGGRMQRMIDQLLDLTRARLAGGIPVTRSVAPLPLAPIVARIVDEVRCGHPEQVIELELDDTCSARLDADRFEQVLSNLVGNAVLHGDPSTPVRVALALAGEDVRVRIENGGPPIDAQFLPVLFNPFVRTSKPASRTSGLGLGLYISERIVDAHGGRVDVRSSPEEGTRFDVLLPVEI